MVDINSIIVPTADKVQNNGASAKGKLTADEYNKLLTAVSNMLSVIKQQQTTITQLSGAVDNICTIDKDTNTFSISGVNYDFSDLIILSRYITSDGKTYRTSEGKRYIVSG